MFNVKEVSTVPMGQAYPNGRCCVFQPCDGAEYDHRYDQVLSPAIEGAGLEPCRIDRDPISTMPIDTLHQEIQDASICIADVTTRNSKVMYQLGFAITAKKDVVILCGPSYKRFPFDVQHRALILYKTGSANDVRNLGSSLAVKLAALTTLQETATGIMDMYAWAHTEGGLRPHESTALALLLANTEIQKDYVTATFLKNQMRKAGYSAVASRMAIYRLAKLGFAKNRWVGGYEAESVAMVGLTVAGREWFAENQTEFETRTGSRL